MKLTDSIGMRGDLTVRVRDAKTNKILRTIEIRNKITFLAADVMVELIAQRATDTTTANNQIYTMRVGTSNTAASRGDTNLGAPVFGVVIGDAGKITSLPGQLEFTITVQSGDANGNTLREAGLFTKGSGTGALDAPGIIGSTPRLFAHQTHPDIVKTIAIALEYSWKIAFTA